MARRAPTRRPPAPPPDPAPSGGGLSSMLRGSVTSVVGAAGLNLPLRAVDQLTRAVERASSLLERVERATRHLDGFDGDLAARVSETFDVIARLGEDARAIRERLDSLETEVHEMRAFMTERLGRLPLLRPSRTERTASTAAKPRHAAKRRT